MSKPCILKCVERPDRVHQERLLTFLRRKYGTMDQELETAADLTVADRRTECPFAHMAVHARSPRKALRRLG